MIFSSPANVPLLSPSSSQMNLFQRLLDIRICFSSNRIMPSSSTPLAWPCIARTRRFHRAKFPLATKSWRVFAKSSLHHRQRLATQRISDRTRVDCTNVVAVAAAIADAVDENVYPLDGRAVGVTREICR